MKAKGHNGQADPYIHGEPWDAGSSIELVYDPELIKAATKNTKEIDLLETGYVLLSEADVEKMIAEETKKKEATDNDKEGRQDD